jgi:methyl coenzyme M reductase gamma subunit
MNFIPVKVSTLYRRYFTSDNELDGIENITHNTLKRKLGHRGDKYPAVPPDVLWVAFSPGSLSIVKYTVL